LNNSNSKPDFGSGKGKPKSSQPRNTSPKGKVCVFCGKENHTMETCYFKHGFLDHVKFKNKNRYVDNSSSHDTTHLFLVLESSTCSSLNISKDDYEVLMDMIRKAKSTASETSLNQLALCTKPSHNTHHNTGINLTQNIWIIDSGAIDHI
jgi:hypothetical protein